MTLILSKPPLCLACVYVCSLDLPPLSYSIYSAHWCCQHYLNLSLVKKKSLWLLSQCTRNFLQIDIFKQDIPFVQILFPFAFFFFIRLFKSEHKCHHLMMPSPCPPDRVSHSFMIISRVYCYCLAVALLFLVCFHYIVSYIRTKTVSYSSSQTKHIALQIVGILSVYPD